LNQLKIQKEKSIRIFLYMHCNYSCDYCSAYRVFNTPLNYKYKTMIVDEWLTGINNPTLTQRYVDDYGLILSGGEPTLYKGFVDLINNIDEKRKIYVYSNISEFAYNKLMQLKRSVILYPSFHIKIELKQNGASAYKIWFERLLDLKEKDHTIHMTHTPDDGTNGIDDLPTGIIRTNIEGYWNDVYHSPYVNECRVNGEEIKKVDCLTVQPQVVSDGTIFNCQAGAWSNRKNLILGNIKNMNWGELPDWLTCKQCGKCHICSQGKVIRDFETKEIYLDKWQYMPVLNPAGYQLAATESKNNRGQYNQ